MHVNPPEAIYPTLGLPLLLHPGQLYFAQRSYNVPRLRASVVADVDALQGWAASGDNVGLMSDQVVDGVWTFLATLLPRTGSIPI